MGEIFGGFAGIVLFIFAVALGIVWIILPFAVLGIRNRLDRVLVQLERIQKALEVRAASGGTLQNGVAADKDETSQTQFIEKSR